MMFGRSPSSALIRLVAAANTPLKKLLLSPQLQLATTMLAPGAIAVEHSASSSVSPSSCPVLPGSGLLHTAGPCGWPWVNVPPYWVRLNCVRKFSQSAGTMLPASTTAIVTPVPVTPFRRSGITLYMRCRSSGASLVDRLQVEAVLGGGVVLHDVGLRVQRFGVEIVQARDACHHRVERPWDADVAGIHPMHAAVLELVVRFLGMKRLADLAGVAAEVDLHLVRVDAVDGEALRNQPGLDRGDVGVA